MRHRVTKCDVFGPFLAQNVTSSAISIGFLAKIVWDPIGRIAWLSRAPDREVVKPRFIPGCRLQPVPPIQCDREDAQTNSKNSNLRFGNSSSRFVSRLCAFAVAFLPGNSTRYFSAAVSNQAVKCHGCSRLGVSSQPFEPSCHCEVIPSVSRK